MISTKNTGSETTIPTRLLRNIGAFCEGRDVVLGAIAASLDTPIDPRASSIENIAIVGSRPQRRERLAGSHRTNLIRLVGGNEDYQTTRKLMKKAHRHKEGTCLAVTRDQRTSVILNQLHLHHDFVLVPWIGNLDRFMTGLIKNAQQNGSQVIADGVCDRYQAMAALALGVQVGTLTQLSIPMVA